jgi:fibronectin type 3 domain-containing protein
MKKNLPMVLLFSAVGLILGCGGCLEKVPEELVSPLPQIPVPYSLSASVSNDSITLYWSADDQYDYSGFAIFRSEVNETNFAKIATSSSSPYIDGFVRPGRVYEYKVAGLSPEGIEGRRSTPLVVQASLFGVTINGTDERTNQPAVQLYFTAPSGTQYVLFSDQPSLSSAVWQNFLDVYPFTFQTGDGLKTIYVRFIDALGNPTGVYSDTILLDTRAAIESLSYLPVSPVPPGQTMHFRIAVTDAETDGTVYIEVPGLGGNIDARDDGTKGDPQSGDGIYERDYALPTSFRGTDILMTATFIDASGNQTDGVEFTPSLDMTDPPSPVTMMPSLDPTPTSVTLRWTKSDDDGFIAYKLYRDDQAGVTQTQSTLVTSLTDQTATLFTDHNLLEGQTYYYAIFVVNDLDESAKSTNEIVAATENPPPATVVLDTVSAVGTNRLTLTWSRNDDSDFREYRVYQATEAGVDTTSTLVGGAGILSRYTTFLDVTGLNLTNFTYYFRVYVFDKAGQFSRSNEVSSE